MSICMGHPCGLRMCSNLYVGIQGSMLGRSIRFYPAMVVFVVGWNLRQIFVVMCHLPWTVIVLLPVSRFVRVVCLD